MSTLNAVRTLVPIVAVPADGAGWNPDYPAALDRALESALAWWQSQLGARPFVALPATAIGLRRPRAAYTPDTQETLRRELSGYYPELAGGRTAVWCTWCTPASALTHINVPAT